MAAFDPDGLITRLVNRLEAPHSMRGAMLSGHESKTLEMFGSPITEGEGRMFS